ncbi:hypothetical protein MCUN1_001789 [Malassezia cuniculi]|uniref:Ribosomal protein S2 n=1 Tax=Malassezia cuniculi TaxID=948313 RepID=A0AAF0EYH2_9BASI|nr:hypothetical protein MCUN1_001789 [Malassezia cuniculi]
MPARLTGLRACVARRALSTSARCAQAEVAFVIPEEPIDIPHADAAAVDAAQERLRVSETVEDPAAASSAHERNVRRMRRTMLADMSGIASTQTRETSFRPFKLRTQPTEPYALTVSHLLAATAQLGHNRAHVKQSYEPLLYGTRHGNAIIDVERATLPALRRATNVVRGITENDGIVLIVGTRPGLQSAIRSAVNRLGGNGFYVSTDRWIPGTLTNAQKLLLPAIQHAFSSIDAETDKVPTNTTKLVTQMYRPDLLIVLNPVENAHAIREATQCNVPTMAIVDTDVDPRSVTYAIPANDDSPRVAELVLGVLSTAGADGLRRRRAALDAWEKAQRHSRRS